MYRRYVPEEDPEPIMHQNVPEHEWSSRLLVLNAARTFHPVKNSRCYLSPDTQLQIFQSRIYRALQRQSG